MSLPKSPKQKTFWAPVWFESIENRQRYQMIYVDWQFLNFVIQYCYVPFAAILLYYNITMVLFTVCLTLLTLLMQNKSPWLYYFKGLFLIADMTSKFRFRINKTIMNSSRYEIIINSKILDFSAQLECSKALPWSSFINDIPRSMMILIELMLMMVTLSCMPMTPLCFVLVNQYIIYS